MIIRCERCSTLYELDESLLAPDGSDVQCTRCQHVFRARPPRAPGQTLQGVPSPEPAAAAEPPRPSSAPAPMPEAAAAPESRGAVASASHQPARYTPGSGPYRPPISQPSVPRAPLIRRDTVGTFESRLRWSHRWKWLAPTAFAAVVGLGVVAFLLRETLIDPRARDGHRAALELAYRDDVASLEQARSRLDETVRAAPRLHSAAADRALVDLLLAGAASERALDRTGAGAAARQVSAAQATAALDRLESTKVAPGEVARARAVAAALASDRAALERFATAARGHLGADPLVEAVEQGADATSGDKVARERAIGALATLVKKHPEVIRARYALARGQALSGRRSEALATLEALLAANPRHEGALALKETLLHSAPIPGGPGGAAPGVLPSAGTFPQPAARTEKPVPLPRKPGSTPGEAGGAPAGGAAASAATPAPPPRPAARAGEEVLPGPGGPDGTGGAGERAPGATEPPPLAPRLRPAAVPEPEPVQGGG